MQKLETRLAILDSRELLRYEEVNEDAVVCLRAELLATGILNNPLICDPELGLLIDGHHRVEALRRLGIEMIPAYVVSYLSDDVGIASYYSFSSCTAGIALGMVEEGIEEEVGDPAVAEHVDFRSDQQVDLIVLSRSGSSHVVRGGNSINASMVLDRVVQQLGVSGFDTLGSCSVSWDELPEQMQSCLYLSPPPAKGEIVTMAHGSGVFPRHVNKHVVDGVVVGIRMPLQVLAGSRAEAEKALRTLLAGAKIQSAVSCWQSHEGVISARYFQIKS